MEYAKDEIFNIKYNEKKDRLEVGSRDSFWHQFLGESKFFKMLVWITAIMSIANIVCIYNFYVLFSRTIRSLNGNR